MKKKIITFTIVVVICLFFVIIIWNKINHKTTDEIFLEKTEQFYENQESFEKIVEYVSGFNFRSITENNKMWGDVIVDGVKFMLQDWESSYTLSLYSKETLLSQLMDNNENGLVVKVIGKGSNINICYDKRSYIVNHIIFTIYDSRIENVMASLVWHTSDYETLTSWVYPLDDNWQIECMGVGH